MVLNLTDDFFSIFSPLNLVVLLHRQLSVVLRVMKMCSRLND